MKRRKNPRNHSVLWCTKSQIARVQRDQGGHRQERQQDRMKITMMNTVNGAEM